MIRKSKTTTEEKMDKKQAGKETLTIEELLEEAARGRSKFDLYAIDINRMRSGGVTLRSIVEWLNSRSVKATSGELANWTKRRQIKAMKSSEVEINTHLESQISG